MERKRRLAGVAIMAGNKICNGQRVGSLSPLAPETAVGDVESLNARTRLRSRWTTDTTDTQQPRKNG